MNYQQFLTSLSESVQLLAGDDARVSVKSVLKNNGLALDGLSIIEDSRAGTPTVYVNQYYSQFEAGRSLDSIAQEILQLKEAHQDGMPPNATDYFDFDRIKHLITYKLINYAENELLLREVPHKKILDLAVVFQCILRNGQDGIASVLVKNSHLDMWGVDEQAVFEHSLENTPLLFPPKLVPVCDLLRGMLTSEASPLALSSEQFPEFHDFPMYVLTNSSMIQGAGCILYDNVLRDFADRTGADLVILPSSIHEVLVIPMEEAPDLSSLNALVREVNENYVDVEEILSWQAYIYRRKTNLLEKATDNAAPDALNFQV
jgi:hypothetical protein